MAEKNQPEPSPDDSEALAFIVELAGREGGPAQVMARAASATLGRAIFEAAAVEHPGRRVILRQGDRILADRPAP